MRTLSSGAWGLQWLYLPHWIQTTLWGGHQLSLVLFLRGILQYLCKPHCRAAQTEQNRMKLTKQSRGNTPDRPTNLLQRLVSTGLPFLSSLPSPFTLRFEWPGFAPDSCFEANDPSLYRVERSLDGGRTLSVCDLKQQLKDYQRVISCCFFVVFLVLLPLF